MDAGGLIALEREDRPALLLTQRAVKGGHRVVVPATVLSQVARDLRASIEYALAHRAPALAHASRFNRGIGEERTDRFVGMYVNEWTVDYGPRGRAAVQLLLDLRGSCLRARDGSLGVVKFGASHVELLLGNRFDLDERLGPVQRRALDLAIGFGLSKRRAFAQELAYELAQFDVVVRE